MDSGQPIERIPRAFFRPISPNYFRALGIPLLRGRELNEHDTHEASPVAVINETMARQFWPGEDPLGRRFRTSTRFPWRTIVGVVGDVTYQGLGEQPIPEMYFAYAQALWPQHDMTVVVRTAISSADLVGVALGMGVGLVGALLGTRALSGLLFGVTPTDPGTWIAVTSLLFAVAFVASYVPARRATRVDPMIALRTE